MIDTQKAIFTKELQPKLPGIQNIENALTNPTNENIKSLQQFLDKNIPDGDIKTALETTSAKNGVWDGTYGTGTNDALNAYLDAFKKFNTTATTTIDNTAAIDKAKADATLTATNTDAKNSSTEVILDAAAQTKLTENKNTFDKNSTVIYDEATNGYTYKNKFISRDNV